MFVIFAQSPSQNAASGGVFLRNLIENGCVKRFKTCHQKRPVDKLDAAYSFKKGVKIHEAEKHFTGGGLSGSVIRPVAQRRERAEIRGRLDARRL
jgi:hypothetical protein